MKASITNIDNAINCLNNRRDEQNNKEKEERKIEQEHLLKKDKENSELLEYIKEDVILTVEYVLAFVEMLAKKGFTRTILSIPIQSEHYTIWQNGIREGKQNENNFRDYAKYIEISANIAADFLEELGLDILVQHEHRNFDGNNIQGWFDIDWFSCNLKKDLDVSEYLKGYRYIK